MLDFPAGEGGVYQKYTCDAGPATAAWSEGKRNGSGMAPVAMATVGNEATEGRSGWEPEGPSGDRCCFNDVTGLGRAPPPHYQEP